MEPVGPEICLRLLASHVWHGLRPAGFFSKEIGLPPVCCTTWVSSCASNRELPTAFPAPKKMLCPTVKACALKALFSFADSLPWCIRTSLKSTPKRGSMYFRTESGKQQPPSCFCLMVFSTPAFAWHDSVIVACICELSASFSSVCRWPRGVMDAPRAFDCTGGSSCSSFIPSGCRVRDGIGAGMAMTRPAT